MLEATQVNFNEIKAFYFLVSFDIHNFYKDISVNGNTVHVILQF